MALFHYYLDFLRLIAIACCQQNLWGASGSNMFLSFVCDHLTVAFLGAILWFIKAPNSLINQQILSVNEGATSVAQLAFKE